MNDVLHNRTTHRSQFRHFLEEIFTLTVQGQIMYIPGRTSLLHGLKNTQHFITQYTLSIFTTIINTTPTKIHYRSLLYFNLYDRDTSFNSRFTKVY